MVRREPYGDYKVRRVAGRRQDTFPLRGFVHRTGVRVPFRQIVLFHRYQPNLPERTRQVVVRNSIVRFTWREGNTRDFEEERIDGEICKRIQVFFLFWI